MVAHYPPNDLSSFRLNHVVYVLDQRIFWRVLTGGFSVCVCRPGEEHLQQDFRRFSDEESLRVGLGQRLLLRVRDAAGERERASRSSGILLWCLSVCCRSPAAEDVGRLWWLLMISSSRSPWRSAPCCCSRHRSDYVHLDLISICEENLQWQ